MTRRLTRCLTRRLIWRVVAVLVAVLAGCVWTVTGSAAPARADIDLCQDAPPPVSPRTGMAGMLTKLPAEIPASAPDPFADPSVPIGEVYGHQWGWTNYDLGCGADFLRDPLAVTNTQSANLAMGVTGSLLAGLAAAEDMARDAQLGWLTDVITTVAGTIRELVLGGPDKVGWLPLAVVALGVVVAFRARSADYAATARTVAVFAVCSVLAFLTLVVPGQASRLADRAITGVAATAGQSFAGSLTDSVAREAAYRTWLTGYFGSADSPLADELGPRLMTATHYTWSDVARIETDPAAREQIDRAKATEFKAVAGEVRDRDPAAYEVFTGRGERIGPALLGIVVAACMSLFAAIAFVMMLLGRTMMQGLVVAAPLASVLGMLQPGQAVLAKMWDLFTAAIVGVAKFTLAAGVMTLVLGGLATAEELSGPERLFWAIVATVVALVLTRPARTFKTFVPGLDPNHSYMRSLLGKLATAAAVAGGVKASGVDLDQDEPDHSDTSRTSGADQSGTAAVRQPAALTAGPWQTESMAALPEPVWVQVDDTPPPSDRTSAGGEQPRAWVAPALVTGTTAAEPPPVESRGWAGVLAATDARPRPALTAGPADVEPVSSNSRPMPAASSPDGDQLGTGSVVGRVRSGGDDPVFVVHPTGVVLAPDPGLYRSGEDQPVEYVRLPEPEADSTGQEHDVVTYRSAREVRS